MVDIYLCRHGRTPLNAAGLLRGRLDPELDLIGQAEARDMAEALSGVGLCRVASSPLQRAMATAELIAGASGLEVEPDERWADRAYGAFDGKSSDDVVAQYGSLDAAPGVEPAGDVAARAQAALADIMADGPTDPVAIVTHDAVIRILLDAVTPAQSDLHSHLPPRTGSWSLLRHDENGWHLLVASSKDHPATHGIGA